MNTFDVDDFTKNQLIRLKNLLKSDLSLIEKDVLLKELDKEKMHAYVYFLIKDVRATLGLPHESKAFIYTRKTEYSDISFHEIFALVEKHIEQALIGIESPRIFEDEVHYLNFDGQRFRVKTVFSKDYEVTVFATLDLPLRFFAEYVYGSHAIYSKSREIKVDADFFSQQDQEEILRILLEQKP